MTEPVILITGASRGLGAATAAIAAELGARLVLNARSGKRLEQVAQAIREAGGTAVAVPGDVSLQETGRRMVAAAMAEYGRIDALINNAGVIQPIAPIAAADPAAWETLLRINVMGPFLLTQHALPHLRASRGRLIHVSSGAAVKSIPGWGAYCTSKAALNHFSRVLADEEPDVTSLTFRPGVVDTEMQVRIRKEGASGMPAGAHGRFVRLHDKGELLPPALPGRALALVALHAPHAWSGEFVQWDETRVQNLNR